MEPKLQSGSLGISASFLPVVGLCAGSPMGVGGGFAGVPGLVEAKAVAAAVSGATELLQQEDHRFMHHAQHLQTVHAWGRSTHTHILAWGSSMTHQIVGVLFKLLKWRNKMYTIEVNKSHLRKRAL